MWQKVAKLGDIPEGASTVTEINGQLIALFKISGAVYAIDNTCPHQGGPLGEGYLDGSIVTCPWHAWQFDVKTGACQSAPDICQKTFSVKVEGDEIFVEAATS